MSPSSLPFPLFASPPPLRPSLYTPLRRASGRRASAHPARRRRRSHSACSPVAVAARQDVQTHLTGPNGLPNARDLSSASPLLREGRIYRGAAPAALAGLPHGQAARLLRSASVLLDLRSKDERAYDDLRLVRDACGDDVQRRLLHVGLLNKRRVVWGLGRVLDTPQLFTLAARVVTNPVRARRTVVREVDMGGLILLNQILVEAGGTQIARALRTVKTFVADDDNGPVYIFCSAGKDRTGLLSALLLSLLGVDEHQVVLDYGRSDGMWADEAACQLRVDYEKRLVLHGLSPPQWLGAPPEVMEQTLKYITRRFGGVEDYLIACGFDESEWQVLRRALL